jgi:V/A-type H+-transporting ATPase subunit F
MSKHNIAIIGPKPVISGFKALGVTPFNANSGEEALTVLQNIKKNLVDGASDSSQTFATVILIESIAHDIAHEDMEKVSRGALPAIVVLPGLEGSHGAGVAKLKSLAEKAIGSDILG